MDFTFIDNRLAVALIAAIIGAILSLVVQRILNKRGIFTYFVQHYQIGESTDDEVFGTIRMTWNEKPVSNLYLSTIELKNESLKDYEDVVVKVFTNDTYLWTEKTEIVGTTQDLRWTAEFEAELFVEQGEQPTETQWDLYRRERKYTVPVMNRDQVIRLVFLNEVKTNGEPNICLDILHKGVKLKLRMPLPEIMGVSLLAGTVAGYSLGLVFLWLVICFIETAWIAAVLCLVYGLFAIIPGVILIKISRWLRDFFGS